MNALEGLAQADTKLPPSSDAPVTPAHRVRRTNTPTLPGAVADVPLLQPWETAHDTKSNPPSVGNTPGNLKTKKKKGKKRPVATPMAGTTAPAVVQPAEEPAVARKAAKKSAAKPPNVETPPPIVKLETVKVKPPQTPPTVRETRAVNAAAEQNMARATTQEQLAQSPAVPAPAPVPDPDSDDDDGDDENPTDDESDDAERNEEPQEEESKPTEAAKELPKDEREVQKVKGKKEKTPEQKAAAARYMRFSRSLVSFLSKALALSSILDFYFLLLFDIYIYKV